MAAQLCRVLATRPNLFSIGLKSHDRRDAPRAPSELTRPFLQAIQQNQSIRRLRLSRFFFTVDEFRELLEAVETSKLEEFSIGVGDTWPYFEVLMVYLPDLPIKKFTFGHGPVPKQDMMQLLKHNLSLQLASISNFDDDDNDTLQPYLDRNKRLAGWIENPASVPRHLWPEALKLAMVAGKNALFQSLLAI